MTQLVEEVRVELLAKGYAPQEIILDGEIHRFDRGGKLNAWYVGFGSKTRSGRELYLVVFGDWKTGDKHQVSNWSQVPENESNEARRFYVKNKTASEAKKDEATMGAVQQAKLLWSRATEAQSHPYLVRKQIEDLKGVKAFVSLTRQDLLIPMRNIFGELRGLQRIPSDGEKRFLTGQSNKGLFFLIPEGTNLKKTSEIYVVEGVATGWSVHKATNSVVACAMNAGNLSDVSLAIKEFNPSIEITVAGDNDSKTVGNPGKTRAIAAATEVAGKYVLPEFMGDNLKLSDFNDLAVMAGLSEVSKQLKSAKKAESKPVSALTLSQQFISRNKMNTFEKKLLAFRQDFFMFNGHFFQKLITSDFLNDIIKFIQKHPLASAGASKNKGSEVLANVEAEVNVKSEGLPPFWIDAPGSSVSNLISVENGLLDMSDAKKFSDIELLPNTSDLFQVSCFPLKFEPQAACPTWMSFLNQMVPDPRTQSALQEWFGYNLVHDTSFEKFAIFFGHGANGKSVCCKVLSCLLGEVNVSNVPLESFDPKRTFTIASTVGKLANIVEELNVDSKTEEGELKKYISGNKITVERKNRDPFDMKPTARLTFATNSLPKFSDSTHGIWRRMLLFPFTQEILDPEKQNRNLGKTEFWKNSGELPGIFNWAVEGLLRLRERGAFTESDEMIKAHNDFKIESNPTKKFLLKNCDLKAGEVLSTRALYLIYRARMEENGNHPLSEGKFANEVKLTFKVGKSDNAILLNGERTRVWYGLSLQSSQHR